MSIISMISSNSPTDWTNDSLWMSNSRWLNQSAPHIKTGKYLYLSVFSKTTIWKIHTQLNTVTCMKQRSLHFPCSLEVRTKVWPLNVFYCSTKIYLVLRENKVSIVHVLHWSNTDYCNGECMLYAHAMTRRTTWLMNTIGVSSLERDYGP